MLRHWGKTLQKVHPQVLWKDLLLGTSGRGYACVFPQDADSLIWIPDHFIRPAPAPPVKTAEEAEEVGPTQDSNNIEGTFPPAGHRAGESEIANLDTARDSHQRS